MRRVNNKLKRAIEVPEDPEAIYQLFDVVEHHVPVRTGTRKEAFDWLQGRDAETAQVLREEKLEIVRAKLLDDVGRIMETCEKSDGWLEHLWGDRNRGLTITPRQH